MSFRILSSTAVIFAVLSTNTVWAQSDECVSVYGKAVNHLKIKTDKRMEKSYYFNLYCERNGEIQEWISSAEVGFPIKGIPFKAKGNNDWSKESLKEFCQIGQGDNFYESSNATFEKSVVTDALDSFNDCVDLAKEDVLITHDYNMPKGVTINIRLLDVPQEIEIKGINGIESDVQCTSTDLSNNKKAIVLSADQGFVAKNKDIAILCKRTPEITGEREFYRRRSLTLATSEGNYTVVMPGEAQLGFHLASEAENAYKRVVQSRNKALKQLASSQKSLKAAQNRLKGIKVFSHYLGDGGWQGRADFHEAACNSPRALYVDTRKPETRAANKKVAESLCATKNMKFVTYKNTGGVGGGCGHTWHAIICIPR